MGLFTEENWNYVQYINNTDSGLRKAILSLGAKEAQNAPREVEFLYFVTILDEENSEIFQEEFKSLTMAIDHINNKFSNCWEFKDLTQAEADKGGCGSCVAH